METIEIETTPHASEPWKLTGKDSNGAYVYSSLEAMGTSELRSVVRTAVKDRNESALLPPVAIIGMKKQECIQYLIGHELPKAAFEPIKPANATGNALELLRQGIEALGIQGKSETPAIDTETLKALIAEEVKRSVKPFETHIKLETKTETRVIVDCQHKLFPLVLKLLSIRGLNLCLTGPAGSGKTQCLMNAAKELKLECYLQPMNIMSTKSDILGYLDATGTYRPSAFYKAFKNGGLFIADEFDCCHAGVATLFNCAIANRVLTFPNNETVTAHENFSCCACMNTIGHGASQQYIGRNALDAATLDRFCLVHFDYDTILEKNMIGIKTAQKYADVARGGIPDFNEVFAFILQVRKDLEALKMKAIVSPRASLLAKKMLDAGIGMFWVMNSAICKGLTPEQVSKVLQNIQLGSKRSLDFVD